ncbi:hypothetical protein GJ496_005254 [Pomphorhynchus laevis]|nr:hypothetical protein GJ496_005254 [Pomphorhynchus laevis]
MINEINGGHLNTRHESFTSTSFNGFSILCSFCISDNQTIIEQMAEQIISLKIFHNENNEYDLTIVNVRGDILSISQKYLYCTRLNDDLLPGISCDKEMAELLYQHWLDILSDRYLGGVIKDGIFGEQVEVAIVNEGQLMIELDSKFLIYQV